MNSNQVYTIMLYAVAKNKQDGYLSPADFNDTLMPVAQASYLDYLLGEYQKYQVGRPIAVVEFGQTEKIRQSIAPLIYGTVLTPNSVTGVAGYPSDFEQVDAMWSVYGFYNIRFVQQDRLASYYRSSIDPVAQNPVYLVKHEGFQFYPEDIGMARMSYVRTPPSIVWGYVEDSNGIPVWNPLTSQDPVWADYDMFNIIVRALALVGVNLQLGVVMQYAQEVKNAGQ
jgi:hypothetical protein